MYLYGAPTGSQLYTTSGTVIKPPISYDGNTFTLTIGEGYYRTFLTTDFTGNIVQFYHPGDTFVLGVEERYYLCVKYNSGNPIMYLETDIDSTNDSDILVIYTIFTEDSQIEYLDWGNEFSMINKINERFIDTDRFGRVYGFDLSTNNNEVISAGGQLYLGTNKIDFAETDSSTDECNLLVKDGLGGWNSSHITVYPNTKYDDGSGTLADLTDGQYGVAWVWRTAGAPKETYVILGSSSYASSDLAKADLIPTDLPLRVSLGSFLIGRIIFQKGATTDIVESSFTTIFASGSPTQHNALLGLQGAIAGQYYHLDLAKYNVVQNTSGVNTGDETQTTIKTKLGSATTSTDGYLTSTDWNTFNDKEPAIIKNTAFNKNYSTTVTDIKVNGTQSLGVLDALPRADHIHPHDNHNDTLNKQGGTTNEYYHLTNSELTGLVSLLQTRLTKTLFEATASTTITNTTAELTQIGSGVGTLTIPANSLKVGDRIRLRTKGYFSTLNNQTSTIRIKVGGSTILTSTGGSLPNSLSNNYVELEFELVVRSAGVSGTMVGKGRTLIASSTGVGNPYLRELILLSPVAINTTISNTVDLTYQWATASPSNSLTIDIVNLEVIG